MQDVEMRERERGQCPVLSYVELVPPVFTFNQRERGEICSVRPFVDYTTQSTIVSNRPPPPLPGENISRKVKCCFLSEKKIIIYCYIVGFSVRPGCTIQQ